MDGLFALRAGATLLGLIALSLAVWKYQQTLSALHKFFTEPSSPVNLGIVRIIVFGTLFESSLASQASWLAGLPSQFQHLPRGWVWLADTGLFEPRIVHAAQLGLIVGSALATAGALTAVAMPLTSLCALLVFGVENFYFKIGHSLHVPTLAACVLAASPAGDALSIDSLLRRLRKRPSFADSIVYTAPVRFCWLLVGTMYLFPGLWKLWESGDQWIDGSKLVNEMFDKWAQLPEFTPRYRFDRVRWLLIILGSWTLVLEVFFFFMLFARATRVAAALFASSFHIGIGFTLGIWFSPFVPLILLADIPQLFELRALAPIGRVFERARARFASALKHSPELGALNRAPRWAAAAFAIGSVWLLGMFAAGLGPIDSWPIAVYPRFSDRKAAPTSSGMSLGVFVVQGDGSTVELPHALDVLGDPAATYRVTRTLVRARDRNDKKTLNQYESLFVRIAEHARGPLAPDEHLKVVSFHFPADPAERIGRGEEELIFETEDGGS
ncbi:MAG: HTTM domain-containing protein [Myxococcota bacterium]